MTIKKELIIKHKQKELDEKIYIAIKKNLDIDVIKSLIDFCATKNIYEEIFRLVVIRINVIHCEDMYYYLSSCKEKLNYKIPNSILLLLLEKCDHINYDIYRLLPKELRSYVVIKKFLCIYISYTFQPQRNMIDF